VFFVTNFPVIRHNPIVPSGKSLPSMEIDSLVQHNGTLAFALLLVGRAELRGKIKLRITIQDEAPKSITLKIEGRVTGPKVPELNRAWQDLATSLGSRKLSVDLRGVTFIDTAGRNILAEIHSKTNADFLADTPMTKYFADEAKRST
jgi:ABC-type transporter Mla MlaB component